MSEEDGRHVRITGRVQVVAFRAWARRRALALGLRGWVRNEPDGSVTALIAGPKADVATMLREFGEGPAAASVAAVESDPADPAGVAQGFEITR